ncbi:dimethylarginine dimethylaminohydrolase family protein [Pleionea mediterranea]|uniref:arginine deiminase n=1 Tax=Pleionea mediterranea TaxID=523701 RepID=A0A316FYK0_9GAMM|nr:arginine deiminase family protein [Pleionea mediterranea]PWK53205.1 N-dimethylarginine dimethylaminohydrolase [Pleionea mediterranea]
MPNTTFQTDVGKIKRILLKHVKDAFRNEQQIEQEWKALHFLDKPDRNNAIREYDALCDLLTGFGIELEFLPETENTTLDSLYPRDNALATNGGMILCTMGKQNRQTEPEHHNTFYAQTQTNVLGEITSPGSVEGGDVAWLQNNVLAVANGYRTNPAGIAQLKQMVSPLVSDFIEVPLPHFRGPSDVFHLMSIISPIADDLAVVYSPLMPVPFRQYLLDTGVRLVEVPEQEYDSQGCNVLAVAPGVCVAVEGNPITHQRLLDAGAEVHTFKGKDICEKGCGGPTCLTRPLEREVS